MIFQIIDKIKNKKEATTANRVIICKLQGEGRDEAKNSSPALSLKALFSSPKNKKNKILRHIESHDTCMKH